MFKNVPHVQNKIKLHVKLTLTVSSFLLLILIKNAFKNAVGAVIRFILYCMVCLENPKNQNSEIAANPSEAGT